LNKILTFQPKNLKKIRKNAGLTQKQLAEKVGVSTWSVINWERVSEEYGKSPTLANLRKLSQVLDVKISDLAPTPENPTLEDIRRSIGINLNEVSEILDLTASQVINIESGNKWPDNIEPLIETYGIDIDEFQTAFRQGEEYTKKDSK